MIEFLKVALVTVVSALAVTALLSAGFAELVKREKSFSVKKAEMKEKHSHDDATTPHPPALV
jgi:hypothetical protein